MDRIWVQGGIGLQGNVRIQGSKNASLPLLAASLLTEGENVFYNCPRITDVYQMLTLLQSLGCKVRWEPDCVRVDAGNAGMQNMPPEAVKGMRSSLCLLGALLGRSGEAVMEYPGGCVIGKRPIDLHLYALEQLGAVFEEKEKKIYATAQKGLRGNVIRFPKVSVGATQNAVLAASAAVGESEIYGAAKEPEVEELCRFLTKCGVPMEGIGTEHIRIAGQGPLHQKGRLQGVSYRVPADRIVAGTYLFACLGAGGSIFLEEAPVEHMEAAIGAARKMGAEVIAFGEDQRETESLFSGAKKGLFVQRLGKLSGVELLTTECYPGFPTDLQSPAMAALSVAEGKSLICESIFENRFRIAKPLNRMGARISLPDGTHALVEGVDRLQGKPVEAVELRGGASLILAGLFAEGRTLVCGGQYIERGYENICRDLRELGARIGSA